MYLDELLRALLDERLEWTDFLELLAVRAGRKSVVRLTGQPDRLEELSRLAQMIDLPCAVAPLHLEGVFVTPLRDRFSRLRPGFPGAGEEGILFIGREEGISRALDMEGEGCPPDAAARLYGYPQCCARVYQNRIQNGQCPWVDSFLAEVRGVAHFPWQMNRMGRLFAPYLSILPDYFPCSPRCAESLNMAESYADLLHEAGLSMLEKLIREHLARPVLRHAGCLYLLHPLRDALSSGNGEDLHVRVMDVFPYAGPAVESPELTITCGPGGLALRETGKTDGAAALMLFE